MNAMTRPMTAVVDAFKVSQHMTALRDLSSAIAPVHALARMQAKALLPENSALTQTLNSSALLGLDAATATRLHSDLRAWQKSFALNYGRRSWGGLRG